jgi:hypothetical protein
VESVHVGSVPVKEVFQGRTVWDGIVEIFDLKRHSASLRAYAWAHEIGGSANSRRHVTVLQRRPIASAQDAVRASIIQEFQSLGTAEESLKARTSKVGKRGSQEADRAVRLYPELLKRIAIEAKANHQTTQEWIQSTLVAIISVRNNANVPEI